MSEKRNALFVLEVATGAVEQVSPETLHVYQFDWSPDERGIVVSAATEPGNLAYRRTDLFVIDHVNRTARPLVTQAGADANPVWSPDGQWVALSSNFGTWKGAPLPAPLPRPAVVRATGGPLIRLGADDAPVLWFAPLFWTADSHGFYYQAPHRMTYPLFKAEIASQTVMPLSVDEQPFDDEFSFSADRRWLAFTRQSETIPTELFLREFPTGPSHQLTRLSPGFSLSALVRADRVSWQSRDQKHTIHGLLLTPRSAWSDEPSGNGSVSKPLPTLVYIEGGPGMVRAGFKNYGYGGGLQALAARGYAVLAPNTRLHVAYSRTSEESDRSYAHLPYEDMMAGVDLLVGRGISDAKRLGLFGVSYGGYLTSYAITQTERFQAAVVNESHVAEYLTSAIAAAPGTDAELMMQGGFGIRNPFDAAERTRILAESPIFNMDRVSTPTLLLFGARSNQAARVGRPLFGALQRLKIPSEFVIYDGGHGFDRPAALADSLTRTADWFDYWVRGMPYPDAERHREYDAWQAARRNHRSAR